MADSGARSSEAGDAPLAVLRWADQLRAIARTGLHYVTDDYNRERYLRIEEIAAEMVAGAMGVSAGDVLGAWPAETGYVTPKVGLVAAIHDDRGRVLLLQRPDSGNWSLPAGFAEVGESPAAGIAREVLEETGLVVVPRSLLGVYDSWLHGSTNHHHIYAVGLVCEKVGGALQLTPEALDLAYFDLESLPSPISRSHRPMIADALAVWGQDRVEAHFDPIDLPDIG